MKNSKIMDKEGDKSKDTIVEFSAEPFAPASELLQRQSEDDILRT